MNDEELQRAIDDDCGCRICLECLKKELDSFQNHKCEGELPWHVYGSAIDYCIERDGKLIAGNEEYESEVRFCPFCGIRASNDEDE